MKFSHINYVLLLSATTSAFAGQALALDGQDLLNKINASYGKQGATLSAGKIEVQGNTIVLKGLQAKPAGDEAPLNVGDVTLSDVQENADGGYRVGKASFPEFGFLQDGVNAKISGFEMGDIAIPGDPNKEGIDGFFYARSIKTGAASVKQADAELVSFSSLDVSSDLRSDKSGFDFSGTVADIKAKLDKIVTDPQAHDAVQKMSIQNITGNVTTKGSWDLGPGTIDLSSLAFSFNNVGKLDISLKFSGYTLAFLKSLQETTEQAKQNANQGEAQQALGMAMLGLMQQLTLDSARIRFDDASITKRALDYAGSMQNVSGQQMAASIKGIVPLMMGQLNMPDLQNAVSAAVNTYMDDPKSFTVAVAPPKPVPLPTIMGAAMGAPNTIPNVIGLKISANSAD
ncbi:DUF945 family protein [Oryzifoliimicrobium ureilyticus]|uniref:DUF945 family protein n=1 Tax=Oryzifoliimicrobium ureilyticus TaxID=3113724 RepID=UPI00307677AA